MLAENLGLSFFDLVRFNARDRPARISATQMMVISISGDKIIGYNDLFPLFEDSQKKRGVTFEKAHSGVIL